MNLSELLSGIATAGDSTGPQGNPDNNLNMISQSIDRHARLTRTHVVFAAGIPPFRQAATAALILMAGGAWQPAKAFDGKAHNVVYVQTNDPAGNAILAYLRQADGSLVPFPGPGFLPRRRRNHLDVRLGAVRLDQGDHCRPDTHLPFFATNGGSDSVAVFRIAPNGSLTPVSGSPFPSGGSNPVSLGLSGNVLCVVNKDNDPDHPGMFLPNYTTFRVNPQGRLIPIPRSTIYEPLGADPSQAFIAPLGSLMFGADFLGGALRSFAIALTGRLTPRAALPLPASVFRRDGQAPLCRSAWPHPRQPLLYVGFVTVSQIGVYRYGLNGSLDFVRAIPDSGKGVCWLRVNDAGTRLYASNTGDPSVSVFDISHNPSNPVEIQKLNPERRAWEQSRRLSVHARPLRKVLPARDHPGRQDHRDGGRQRHPHLPD